MEQTLRNFASGNLYDACNQLLSKLQILHTQEEPTPMRYEDFFDGDVPQYIKTALELAKEFYYIGEVCDDAIKGESDNNTDLREDLEKLRANAHYKSMMLFAVDLRNDVNITRSNLSVLTRAFNRLVYNFPVTVIFRQGKYLSIGTCERTEFKQEWRQGQGEKLGKVSLLRNVDCHHPHRGHLMIMESIGDKAYLSFDDLYANWQQVFSSELLTRKFYSELSNWYAWAVQVARFPNDLSTKEDDERFNHESCIRLITRLIFVWFLKQKRLIPEEFFDEKYIHNHFIKNFNPHDRENLLYNSENSKYYRLILQNLFFAMLNRPIVPEDKNTTNNRRFRSKGNYHGMNPDYAVNNLLRYEAEFMEGGAAEFLKIANSNVPFLNGGLFDCLDDKPKNLYYDGFSERKESIEQLFLPDWLFFGEEVGKSIDLSKWYGDEKKKNVSARGIIDILKRYNFTIEENTPLDQEVSLDPELLGKVFENLLAAVNPDTKISARKQTGSFYTPREVVKFIVDESLVEYLKGKCGNEKELIYRNLLNYSTRELNIGKEDRFTIMKALYNCRVLDPACGSGAFPMGILQQMVHILRKLDPTNEMWKEFLIDIAIDQSRKAYNEENEIDRKLRLTDIEDAFNRHINDPDYARKLYLIEHCIFGVDIQAIAVQISKLRFFISLVVDQKPTKDAKSNFGIRPLPNLEAKFVAANSLVPIEFNSQLVDSAEDVTKYRGKLKELNHKIFLAKRNAEKERLRKQIKETRVSLAEAIENTGFAEEGVAKKLSEWDMFDQNSSSSFFDAEWMFGLKDEFDILIGNPPYNGISDNNGSFIKRLIEDYKREPGTKEPLKERKLWLQDDYVKFIRFVENNVSKSGYGIVAFINNNSFIDNPTFRGMRWHLMQTFDEIRILDLHGNARKNNVVDINGKDENVFNIMQGVSINIFTKFKTSSTPLSIVYYADICGTRTKKLKFLSNATYSEVNSIEIPPYPPLYLMSPQTRDGIDEYEKGFRISEIMPECVTGVVTARDGLVIDIDKETLLHKIELFVDETKSDSEIRDIFFGNKKSAKYLPGDSRGWSLSKARIKIKNNHHQDFILPLAFRVFDNRYIYYSPDMVDWGREDMYSNIIGKDNICLVVPRQTTKEWNHVFVSDKVANFNFLATGGQNGAGTHFPLYIYKDHKKLANINKTIKLKIEGIIGRELDPEELFNYIYGVLHSKSYRKKYMEFLKMDFPKIPYPNGNEDFLYYNRFGEALKSLHLFKNIPLNTNIATYNGDGINNVAKISYKDSCVYINSSQYFKNIPPCIWNAKFGDDRPAERWLKERKGRRLSRNDINYYRKMAYVINETCKLVEQIK